jgi:hypothetical protein
MESAETHATVLITTIALVLTHMGIHGYRTCVGGYRFKFTYREAAWP